jgi:hypothetical protein
MKVLPKVGPWVQFWRKARSQLGHVEQGRLAAFLDGEPAQACTVNSG